MDRLASEVFGEFVADGDVADRLALAHPQRFEGRGPSRPHLQLVLGEGLEQVLWTVRSDRSDMPRRWGRPSSVPARR